MYNPQDNFEIYTPRIADFVTAGQQAGLAPAATDSTRTALLLIDEQIDFVHKDGNLKVDGADADLQRLNEFIYRNVEGITQIISSLDTHYPYQIFFPTWWAYVDDGSAPAPYTMISLNKKGEPVDQNSRTLKALLLPAWSNSYLRQLKAASQKDLMIWPFHCLEGSPGRALMPALSEAIAYHAAARMSQPKYRVKGQNAKTEMYSIFGAEVPDPDDTATQLDTAMLNTIAAFDRIYIAGQARSHCVLETMKHVMNYFGNQPKVLRKLFFLEDCTSSVYSPDVDFEAIAQAAFADFARKGLTLVKSTDSI